MKKGIAFFTVGFAFNRLVRMRFYEKIFPKDVKIFLITTDRYVGKEEEHYQQRYDLKRTKLVTFHHNPITLPFEIRRFCKENSIDRLINLGFHTSAPILFLSTLFSDTDYCLNILTDVLKQHYLEAGIKAKMRAFSELFLIYPFVFFSKKSFFTDLLNAKRAPIFFLSPKQKIRWLAAPVDTDFFKSKNKTVARKKLHLPLNKKIVIFVGRINYLKCSDVLSEIVRSHPEIHFVVIGRLIDQNFPKKAKNLTLISDKSSEELLDYYSASDFSFCANRGGGGIGLSTEEALACGVPVLVSKDFELDESEAVYQVQTRVSEVEAVIKSFFDLSQKERDALSRKARDYAVKKYSNHFWKEKYIKAYLE